MVKVHMVLDDVIIVMKKGKRVIAEHKATLKIPQEASSTGKRRLLHVDVSDEGLKLLQDAEASRDKSMEEAQKKYEEGLAKLEEERKKALLSAWNDMNKIADKVEESRPKRKRKTDKQEDENRGHSDQDQTQDSPQQNHDVSSSDVSHHSDQSQDHNDGQRFQNSYQQQNNSWN